MATWELDRMTLSRAGWVLKKPKAAVIVDNAVVGDEVRLVSSSLQPYANSGLVKAVVEERAPR